MEVTINSNSFILQIKNYKAKVTAGSRREKMAEFGYSRITGPHDFHFNVAAGGQETNEEHWLS